MKLIKRLTSSLAIFTLLFLNASPAMAQSVLEDIKGRLESEGIEVVDYSAPEGQWGSIPSEWVSFLSGSYTGIAELSEDFKDTFDTLTEDRRELAVLEAERSRLTVVPANDNSEVDTIEEALDAIAELETEIAEEEADIKNDLADLIADTFPEFIQQFFPNVANAAVTKSLFNNIADTQIQLIETRLNNDLVSLRLKEGTFQSTSQLERDLRVLTDQLQTQGLGVNILFQEIDFYLNRNKWGRLPLRVIGILELDTDFESLQDMVEIFGLNSTDPEVRQDGVDDLIAELEGVEDLTDNDIDTIVSSTIILSSPGEGQINQIFRAVANTIKNLVIGIAVLWIVIAAIRMIFAQGDETIITEQKRAITFAVIGLMAILLVDRGIDLLYGAPGQIRTELTADQRFTDEVMGLVSFVKALVGTVAILFIVISGVQMIFASGEEDQISAQKRSLLWIGVGLILVAIDEIVVRNVFIAPTQQSDRIRTSNIVSLIDTVGTVLQFLLGFVGLIAFGALVYGGAMMIMNYGNDEMVEKAKKIIRNAIIGIIVVISAYVVVASLVVFR